MKHIWEFYENMNESVYVSDLDTYEMVYLNKYGREKLGVASLDDIVGQPCYKVLQGYTSPCAMCTNHKLKPDEFYEWKYHDTLLGRTYNLKDTVIEQAGKRYRMEISIGSQMHDEQEQAIHELASNEALVNEGLRLALSESTPIQSIHVLLKYLGQSLKSERVFIFEETPNHTFKNTYEWCADGVEPQIDNLQDVPAEAVELWYKSFLKNENVVIKNIDHIKESNPKAYEYLEPQQIHSLVVSPIVFRDQIIGFYGVDNPPKKFLNHISVMFMVLGHFIASILRRRDLVKRLEAMSYYDQLTGALNRHGMNEFVANVDPDASIGIIYCDVMGLKTVNDTKGHLEGDALLMRSYQCLTDVFPKNKVFRIGGDEFLAMGSNVTLEDLYEKVRLLKEKMPEYNVNFAIGWVWEPKCNGRITELLKIADHRMYEEKEKYYAEYGKGRIER